MAVKYVCCQCDTDMTTAVQSQCNSSPVLRPMLILKGAEFQHSMASVVTLTCPNGHTCSYPCSAAGMSDSDQTIRGVVTTSADQQELTALRALFDAKPAMDRLDSYGKWLFSSAAIVGSLGAGLSNTSLSKLRGYGIFSFALAILMLGVCLVAASLSIAPHWEEVRLTDLENLRKAVQDQFVQRRKALNVAAVAFVVALVLATLSPLISLVSSKSAPVMHYTLNDKGELDAGLEATGLDSGTSIELQLESLGPPRTSLAHTGSTTDENGQIKLTLKRPGVTSPPVDLVSCIREPSQSTCSEKQRLHVLAK